MAKRQTVRQDGIFDSGDGPLFIGSSSGDRQHVESVGDYIEELKLHGQDYDTAMHGTQVVDVTDIVRPIVEERGAVLHYRPEHPGDVRYIEVTKRQVFAVYRGSLRPDRTTMGDVPERWRTEERDPVPMR